jgi:hypothetical protein
LRRIRRWSGGRWRTSVTPFTLILDQNMCRTGPLLSQPLPPCRTAARHYYAGGRADCGSRRAGARSCAGPNSMPGAISPAHYRCGVARPKKSTPESREACPTIRFRTNRVLVISREQPRGKLNILSNGTCDYVGSTALAQSFQQLFRGTCYGSADRRFRRSVLIWWISWRVHRKKAPQHGAYWEDHRRVTSGRGLITHPSAHPRTHSWYSRARLPPLND